VLRCAVLCFPAGADVKVTYATPSALLGTSAGDVAATGVTKNDGSFAVGPLPGDATYTVEVAKAGHVLTQEAGGEQGRLKFSSKQLAQVRFGALTGEHDECECWV
jgi:streptogramin lyase